MKIVDRKTFLALPPNTVYTHGRYTTVKRVLNRLHYSVRQVRERHALEHP